MINDFVNDFDLEDVILLYFILIIDNRFTAKINL
jgi:hypothetical protein